MDISERLPVVWKPVVVKKERTNYEDPKEYFNRIYFEFGVFGF